MASARSTATDGDSWFLDMPNRYGSKPLVRQQNECMFGILNKALDGLGASPYDPPVYRISVHYVAHWDGPGAFEDDANSGGVRGSQRAAYSDQFRPRRIRA